jgi:hypothetical protein
MKSGVKEHALSRIEKSLSIYEKAENLKVLVSER